MTKKELMEKYVDVLDAIAKATDVDGDGSAHSGVDMGMALTIMENAVIREDYNVVGVPEDFDWKQFKADLA